jgi:ParB/RepB/Spo0J family partition protein
VSASNGSAPSADLRQVPVELIDTDGKNLRREQGDVSGLQASLAELGMLQPITVRPIGDRFEVVAGHRRLAAAVKAGYSNVPCIVREMDDRTKWVMRVGENLHRKNLTPSEEGRLYQQLAIEGYTQREIAGIAGCSQSHISLYLRILTWPPRIVLQLDRGELTMTKAEALAGDLNGTRTPGKAQVEPGERLGHDFDPSRGRGPLHVARDEAPNGKGDGRVLNVHSLEEMARFFRTVADDEWANGAMRSKARQLLKIATQALGAEQVGGGVDDE